MDSCTMSLIVYASEFCTHRRCGCKRIFTVLISDGGFFVALFFFFHCLCSFSVSHSCLCRCVAVSLPSVVVVVARLPTLSSDAAAAQLDTVTSKIARR